MSAVGTTVCVACNVAISVRIASPGDTGDVTQTTGAASAATTQNAALTAQAAAESAAPLAAPPPAPVPPAPPAPVAVPPPVVVSPPVPPPVTPLEAATVPPPAVDEAFLPQITLAPADDPAPKPVVRARSRAVAHAVVSRGGRTRVTTFAWAATRVVVTHRSVSSPAPRPAQPHAAAPSTRRTSIPPAPPTQPPRAPLAIGSGATEPTHGGSGGSPALAMTAAGLAVVLLYVVASFFVPRARGALGAARPHPPG